MAIVKGLEPGAVLWKYIGDTPRTDWRRNEGGGLYRDEDGRPQQITLPDYRIVKLYNRRCRTNGCIVNQDLYPFLSKLNIRLPEFNNWRHETPRYIAIGCEDTPVREDQYNSAQIDPVAQRYYDRLNNQTLSMLIQKQLNGFTKYPIAKLQNIDLSEWQDESNWPREPHMREYPEPVYGSGSRYRHRQFA